MDNVMHYKYCRIVLSNVSIVHIVCVCVLCYTICVHLCVCVCVCVYVCVGACIFMQYEHYVSPQRG